jgi:hypothetical protein
MCSSFFCDDYSVMIREINLCDFEMVGCVCFVFVISPVGVVRDDGGAGREATAGDTLVGGYPKIRTISPNTREERTQTLKSQSQTT